MQTNEVEKFITDKLFPGEPIRPFTSNMEDALALLNKLRDQGWFWRLDSVHDGVVCTVQNLARKTYSIRAGSAPKSVCECAVKILKESDANKQL